MLPAGAHRPVGARRLASLPVQRWNRRSGGDHRRGPDPGTWLLAALAYIPLLATHPGMVGADTKTYLYLNPGKLLSRAPFLWDPGVGLGTVTHQNIGYLFPMGPYYAVMDWLGIPDWISQRLWMGSIIFLAGLGVRALLKTLDWKGRGTTVASIAYALSPYLLHYIYKHSVILLPFTALPWLLTFLIRSLREGGWKYPALFALVTLASGGVNATSLILVMVGPLVWVLHVVVVEKEATVRSVIPPLLRIGVLTVVTSLWWMAGLTLQGSNGIDILRFTETYKTVSNASSSTEILRGLGYWFFYGTDALGPWFRSAVTMTESIPALVISFMVPLAALVAALWTRWRYRVFFVAMSVAGLVISVGAFPFDDSSPYGSLFAAFTKGDTGLALRSTPRAVPLVALSAAVFLAAGVAALAERFPRRKVLISVGALGLVVANMSPLFVGNMLDPFLERPEDIPAYWTEAGQHLDLGDRSTRALEVPGIEFAAYRWGSTVDPVTPGLTDRDYAARELIPWGSPASADLMNAVDQPFQTASFNPAGYATILRYMGVGDLVSRNDLQYERYDNPRPRLMASWLDQVKGLGAPLKFPASGSAPNRAGAANPMIDDVELGIPPTAREPAPVEIRKVADTAPILRTVSTSAPVVLSGSGDGLVAAANSGLIDPSRLVLYSASLGTKADSSLITPDASLVVTDSNRRAARRWGASRENDGYTEMADETPPSYDPTDNRLPLFPGQTSDAQTVVIQKGSLRVRASDYGNQLTYTPGDRAAGAFDDDPSTAWKVGAFADVRNQWIEASSTTGPIETDHIGLLQAQTYVNRFVTKLDMSFDGGAPVTVALNATSRTGAGQVVTFPKRRFTTVRLTIRATDPPDPQAQYQLISGVGFARIDIDGRVVTEVVRPPVDLTGRLGASTASHDLSYVLTRRRSNPAEPIVRSDELSIARRIDSPAARSFDVTGTVRLNPSMGDPAIDKMLEVPTGSWTFETASRLNGDLVSRGSKAFDGDLSTWWQSQIDVAPGVWIDWSSPTPGTFTFTGLDVLNDPNHSIPAVVHLEVDGVAGPMIELSAAGAPGPRWSVTGLTTPQPVVVTGSHIRLVVDRLDARTQPNWRTKRPSVMPIGIAEVRIGTTLVPAGPASLDGSCRTGLLKVGDTDIPLRLTGSTADAQAGNLIAATGCTPAALPGGVADLVATDGRSTGLDLDSLTLGSKAPSSGSTPGATAPALSSTRTSRGSYDLSIGNLGAPTWLVLGQSLNDGWHLVADGKDLGAPILVNGYANGWRLDPAVVGSHPVLTLEWTPQRYVWLALALSLAGFVLCLALAFWPRRRRPGDRAPSGQAVRPRLIDLTDSYGAPVGWVTTAIVATASVGVTLALVTPWYWAVAVGALALVALRTRQGWVALRFVAVAAFGLAATFVIAKQWRNGYADDFDWPQKFLKVHSLAMFGWLLLGLEVTVEAIRAGWRRDTGLDDPSA